MKGHQLFAAARYFVLFCVLFMAEPVKGAAADSPMVKYCYNDWRPYTFTRGDQPAGLSVEIMREATRRIGAEAELSELPWKRCLDLVAKGQMDAVMDAASRPQFVHGEVSYSIYSDTFWTLADAGINRFSWDLVRGKSVGLVNGYQYGAALTDNLAKANVRIVYSYDDPANIRMLTGGACPFDRRGFRRHPPLWAGQRSGHSALAAVAFLRSPLSFVQQESAGHHAEDRRGAQGDDRGRFHRSGLSAPPGNRLRGHSRARACQGSITGRVKMKRLPWLPVTSRSIRPPCCSAMRRQMARPMPLPS